MKNKILTAEELIRFLEIKGTIFSNEKEKLRVKNSFIEFAKLHVKKALKQVSEKAIEMNQWENEKISKNAIIKSYDLNNIK